MKTFEDYSQEPDNLNAGPMTKPAVQNLHNLTDYLPLLTSNGISLGNIYLWPLCQLIQHKKDIFFPGTNSSFW